MAMSIQSTTGVNGLFDGVNQVSGYLKPGHNATKLNFWLTDTISAGSLILMGSPKVNPGTPIGTPNDWATLATLTTQDVQFVNQSPVATPQYVPSLAGVTTLCVVSSGSFVGAARAFLEIFNEGL